MICKCFVSYQELFRDKNEPENRGVCTVNPYWSEEDVIELAVVDINECSKDCQFFEPANNT